MLVVLWSMIGLALLGARMAASARDHLRAAAAARDLAVAEAAADGAIRQVMFLMLGGGGTGPLAIPPRVRIGEVTVSVVTEDEAEKINPNAASRDVLRGLAAAVGVDQARAALLSGELADWRTRSPLSLLGGMKIDRYRDYHLPYGPFGQPFASLEEMRLVPDMTPEIMARMAPWLSIYHEGEVTDPGARSPAGAAAGDAAISASAVAVPVPASRSRILRATATAVSRGKARFVRSAVLRLRPSAGTDARPIQVLTWE